MLFQYNFQKYTGRSGLSYLKFKSFKSLKGCCFSQFSCGFYPERIIFKLLFWFLIPLKSNQILSTIKYFGAVNVSHSISIWPLEKFIFASLGFYFPRKIQLEMFLVRLLVYLPNMSVRPLVTNFSQNRIISFSHIVHDDSWPWFLVTD